MNVSRRVNAIKKLVEIAACWFKIIKRSKLMNIGKDAMLEFE